jgi:uncharacterized protein (TIGR03083 family)
MGTARHTARMDLAVRLEHLRTDAAAFARAIESGDLDAHVPSCPDWCLSDLAWHVIEVHDFWKWVVQLETLDPSGYPEPERVVDEDLVSTFEKGAEEFFDVLGGAQPETELWTWSHERNAGFVQRFQVQEMAVHRWDAQYTAGPPEPIATDIALDGLTIFAEFLVPPNVEGAFVVQPTGGKPLVVGGLEPVAVLSGDPSDLLLALWRRLPIGPLVTNGDPDTAKAYLDTIAFG